MTGARKVQVHAQDKPYARMLKGIRQARHWSQLRMAIELEVRRNTIWRWETGVSEPSAQAQKLIMLLFSEK